MAKISYAQAMEAANTLLDFFNYHSSLPEGQRVEDLYRISLQSKAFLIRTLDDMRSVLNTPVNNLGLTDETSSLLDSHRFHTIGDIIYAEKNTFRNVPRLGPKKIKELQRVLEAYDKPE